MRLLLVHNEEKSGSPFLGVLSPVFKLKKVYDISKNIIKS